ncbi:MAG TPA: Sir2 family NAD-dependent protein deacetylase, partial [Thermomicrobiales bacterium]|nr:Sir2 family NAD-dependent protein deacetylase [Thermomicrobiales bacterium]
MGEPASLEEGIARLAALIAKARYLVAFTGAGVSTESGIPDFRSPGGIWNRYKPIDYQTFLVSEEARREYWRRGKNTYAVIRAARPNPAHLALVELERRGTLRCLITQNIDGLHAAAGSSPERTIELHGTAHRVYCMDCGAATSRDEVIARLEAGEAIPACLRCGGMLRSGTVAFGEPLPREPWRRAVAEARQSDLFLVIGSSLVVNPAAHLPLLAADAGADLVIVNQTPTPL